MNHSQRMPLLNITGLLLLGLALAAPSPFRSAPAAGGWTATSSLNAVREQHTATLLTTGKVLVAGGYKGQYSLDPLSSAELYDPGLGTWNLTGSLHAFDGRTGARVWTFPMSGYGVLVGP